MTIWVHLKLLDQNDKVWFGDAESDIFGKTDQGNLQNSTTNQKVLEGFHSSLGQKNGI